jgi:hypothetical protein
MRSSGSVRVRLGCFDNVAGFNATGANHHFFDSAVGHIAHALQIGIKSALGQIVCMADIVAHHWFFATYFTYFRHF